MKRWICFTILMGLVASTAQAAQETWGGDTASLKFVKFGRLVIYEMDNNPHCNLMDVMSKQKLTQLVDSIEVQSTETDTESKPGKIYFNRLKWVSLSQGMKARDALIQYAQQGQVVLTKPQAAKYIGNCSGSKYWPRNSNLDVPENIETVKDLEKEVLAQSKDLQKFLSTSKFKDALPGFDLKQMSALIDRFELKKDSTENDGLNSRPVVFVFPGNVIKDGKNTKDGDLRSLSINKSIWKTLSGGQKKEFLLHEFLGLLSINDQNYQHSSLLFFELGDDDYTH